MDAFAYVDGAARYIACAIEGKYGETVKARLTLDGGGHLYDCRSGKYLGTGAGHEVELRRATGNLFALLPYRVERIELAAPAKATAGRPIAVRASVKTGAGAPVRHVLVMQLRRPDGRDLPVHRWVFETRTRSVEANLFLALNDPAGKWTLAVFDVATGVRREQPIELRTKAQ